MKIRRVAVLISLLVLGCQSNPQTTSGSSQPTVAASPSTAESPAASADYSAIAGKYACQTLAYKDSGVLDLQADGNYSKNGDNENGQGKYTFANGQITWTEGLLTPLGSSVYTESGDGNTISLQAAGKDADRSNDQVCKLTTRN